MNRRDKAVQLYQCPTCQASPGIRCHRVHNFRKGKKVVLHRGFLLEHPHRARIELVP
jgi:hypothetical protein